MPFAQKNLSRLLILASLLSTTPAHAGFFDDIFDGIRGNNHGDNGPSWSPFGQDGARPGPAPEELPPPPVMGRPKPALVGPFSSVAAAANLTDLLRLSLSGPGSLKIGKQFVSKEIVARLYSLRGFQPLFVNEQGLTPVGQMMRRILVEEAPNRGLSNSYYWSSDAEARLAAKDITSLGELDLLLSISYLQYANDSSTGRTNPQDASQNVADVEYTKRSFNDYALLNQITGSPEALFVGLQTLEPKHPAYLRMVTAMTRLQALKKSGGWPKFVADKLTKPGTAGKNVTAARARLFALGMLPDSADRDLSNVYDATLVDAVKNFQEGAKMNADGQLGDRTLTALDVSIDSRIRQLQVNLERYRLLPKDFGPNYIFADLGRQHLRLVQNGQEALSMKLIVGQTLRQTPSFPDEIGYLIVNPYWFAPGSIVVKDILPQAMANPDFFHQLNMKVFDNGREMDTERLGPDFWSQYSLENRPPFTFREEPGPNNSLGRVKFQLLRNTHDIYMHDTNHRELFANLLRTNSSGCMRVEKPVELATALLANQGISKANIDAMIADPLVVAKKMPITAKLPVYVMGTTIALNGDKLMFGPDIYGQDKRLLDAMNGLRIIPTAKTMNFLHVFDSEDDSTL
jgi:murein L,D-transpeptidase YcbB/YkuD